MAYRGVTGTEIGGTFHDIVYCLPFPVMQSLHGMGYRCVLHTCKGYAKSFSASAQSFHVTSMPLLCTKPWHTWYRDT